FISWALGLGSSARCQYLDKRCASIVGPRAPIAWLNGYNHAVVSVLFISGWPFSGPFPLPGGWPSTPVQATPRPRRAWKRHSESRSLPPGCAGATPSGSAREVSRLRQSRSDNERPWRLFRLIFREPGDMRKMPPRQGRGREGIRRSGWEDSIHGCLHEFLDTADRDVSLRACAGAAESVEEAAARGSRAVAPVLASHPEPGEPGTSGPLSAIGPWFLLDAAQSAADDGDPVVGFLGSFSRDRKLSGVPVRGDGPVGFSEW